MGTEETKKFECERCGSCCKNIGNIEECKHLDNGYGICKYYDDNNKECKIYDFRPEICNVHKLYRRYKNKMTWEEYLDENKKGCLILRDLEKQKN